jgi:hypothetical protein
MFASAGKALGVVLTLTSCPNVGLIVVVSP